METTLWSESTTAMLFLRFDFFAFGRRLLLNHGRSLFDICFTLLRASSAKKCKRIVGNVLLSKFVVALMCSRCERRPLPFLANILSS